MFTLKYSIRSFARASFLNGLAVAMMIAPSTRAQSVGSGPNAESLPNLIVILADDIGWGDLGSYGGQVDTPHLDRLANEGMRFTDAHSPAALCAPTRFSMMTGSNPYRNGRPWGTWSLRATSAFSTNRKHDTAGDVAQAAGYRTGFVGKQNFGGTVYDANGNPTTDYQQIDFSRPMTDGMSAHGFDYSLGLSSGIQNPPYVYWENDAFKPINGSAASNAQTRIWAPGSYLNVDGTTNTILDDNNHKIGDVAWNSAAVGPRLAQACVDFIDGHQANHDDQPFLLYYASQCIHVPHTPTNFLNGEPIRDTQVNVKLDMIRELDATVGTMLQKLDELDIADQTIVIFTSDNGGLAALGPEESEVLGHDSVNGLRGRKSSPWEGGHRVPFIVRWGDGTPEGSRIAPGSVNPTPIVGHDWVASLYDLTGQNMPSDQSMDAASLLPTWFGYDNLSDPSDDPHAYFLLQSATDSWQQRPYVMRQDDAEGQWVLILNRNRVANQFFDLSTDLAQTNDLINDSQHAERITAMQSLFRSRDAANDPRTTTRYQNAQRTPWPNLPVLQGDANFDGEVGLLDLDILGAMWERTPASRSMGDFNGDGVVGLLDLDILGANWGTITLRSALRSSPGRESTGSIQSAGFGTGERSRQ